MDPQQKKVEVKCIDVVLGEDTNKVKSALLDQLKGKKMNDTGNLAENVCVAVDLCYDTSHNIAVNDGICNGTPCILKKIHYFESKIAFQVVCGFSFQIKALEDKQEKRATIIKRNILKFQMTGRQYGLLKGL